MDFLAPSSRATPPVEISSTVRQTERRPGSSSSFLLYAEYLARILSLSIEKQVSAEMKSRRSVMPPPKAVT